jgi:hypothetical protein
MRLFILNTFLFFPFLLFSQKITPKQAVEFTQKLYQVEILSAFGRDSILEKVSAKDGSIYTWIEKEEGVFIMEDSLLCSNVLYVCKGFFESEKRYRTGSKERSQSNQALRKEMSLKFGDNELTGGEKVKAEAHYDSVQSALQKKIEQSEGFKIEKSIMKEDTFPVGFHFYESDMFVGGYPQNETAYKSLIHSKRSILGKHRTKTLNDLLKIGLIDKKIYDETLPKIKSNELIFEWYVLKFVAEKVEFYENFEKK